MTATPDDRPRHHRHPILRGLGHAFGLAYVLVTLLFGPIRSLARWLERQQIVRRYERRVAVLPPSGEILRRSPPAWTGWHVAC